MIVQTIASAVLIGIGAVVFAQGTVNGPAQGRWFLSGAALAFLGVCLLGNMLYAR